MLYWIQILPPIGGATSMDFFTTHIACLIAALEFYLAPFDMKSQVVLTGKRDIKLLRGRHFFSLESSYMRGGGIADGYAHC